MKKIIFILALPLFLASCGIHRPSKCYQYVDTTTHVRVDTIETLRVDTTRIKGDTVTITDSILVDCVEGKAKFKPFKKTVNKGGASTTVSIDSLGALSVQSVCDSVLLVNKELTREINTLKEHTLEMKPPAKGNPWRTAFFVLGLVLFLQIAASRIIK